MLKVFGFQSCLSGETSRTSFQNKAKFMDLYRCKIQPRHSTFHQHLLYSEIGQTFLKKKEIHEKGKDIKEKEQEEGKEENKNTKHDVDDLSWIYEQKIYCSSCLITKSCLTPLQPHGLWPIRLLCPWDPPGKNTGVGCHFLLHGIFLTPGWNLRLLH